MTLSISIICRNNEATIGRTLESVAGLANEIVAVDSGSTDGTIPLLERHNARVIRSPWVGYVRTKQLALESCTGDWVLCLDSDESVEPDLRESIKRAISLARGPDGYLVNRKVYYRARPLNFAWQPEHRLRLVRRGRAAWAGLDPHDSLEMLPADALGTVGEPKQQEDPPRRVGLPRVGLPKAPKRPAVLAGTLRHDSISTFSDFFAKQAVHARTMAESLRREGRRGSLLALVCSPPGAFLKQLVLKQAFRDGIPGWLAAASTAGATLMKHAALLEQTRVPPGDVDPPARPSA